MLTGQFTKHLILSEPLEAIERNVTIHIHPNFTLSNLKNDLAILRLNTMVPLGQYPTIGTVCLPSKLIHL